MKLKRKNIDKTINRKLAVEAGFYDGRFKTRVVPDKRKQESKFLCRSKVTI